MHRRGVTCIARAHSRRLRRLGVRHCAVAYDENAPPSYVKFPPAPRPEGVPDTWSASDIETDLGFFEDDCFPPALPGETLEEYCRRVPNIWSPCSRSTDVVDCPVYVGLEFAQDVTCEDHQFSERPLVKIPPLDSDWHAVHEVELEMVNPEDPYLLNGMNPPRTSELTVQMVAAEQNAIMAAIRDGAQRLGHDYWFQSDNFEEFWQELTETSLKQFSDEKMTGHLMQWLEQNPGKTLNEICKEIDPLHKDLSPEEAPFWNVKIEEVKGMMEEQLQKQIETSNDAVAKKDAEDQLAMIQGKAKSNHPMMGQISFKMPIK